MRRQVQVEIGQKERAARDCLGALFYLPRREFRLLMLISGEGENLLPDLVRQTCGLVGGTPQIVTLEIVHAMFQQIDHLLVSLYALGNDGYVLFLAELDQAEEERLTALVLMDVADDGQIQFNVVGREGEQHAFTVIS